MAKFGHAPDEDLIRKYAEKGSTIMRIEDRYDGWFLVSFTYPITLPDDYVFVEDCLDEMEAAAFVLKEMEKYKCPSE